MKTEPLSPSTVFHQYNVKATEVNERCCFCIVERTATKSSFDLGKVFSLEMEILSL